jgi:hypothetical protein
MKAMLVLLIILSVVLMVIFARRRLWLGLKLTAAAFVGLNLYRFALATDETERFVLMGLALGAFGLVWLVLWGITRLVERHRALHPSPPRPPQRRWPWQL